MATNPVATDDRTERCDACGRETLHEVRIEIRTESTRDEHAAFSREPYRITTCGQCGETRTTRMNNA